MLEGLAEIAVDGRMGPATIAALQAATERDRAVLLVTLNSLQCARYVEICERELWRRKWFRGWVRNRVQLRAVTLNPEA
ncbi:MAG TPA: hypothetical protein ENO24_00150 [Chloroflexi bacterium]|nr:hypothetical protein [Chloroflexota bacterium]